MIGVDKEMINHQKKSILAVDTIVNITMDDLIKIEDCGGVYILITKSGRTYIGSSKNIRKRIVGHRGNAEFLFDLIESIIIYVTDNVESARILKKNLIMDMRPDINNIYYDTMDNKTKYAIRNFFRYSRNWLFT